METNNFDVIVIGSGISGSWAAKEFTEKGLKTLLLERGRKVEHLKDYPTTNLSPFEFPHLGELTNKVKKENPIASKCYAFREDAMHFFVKDKQHPYQQSKPFDWIRGYQLGGRSITWGRQTQRWSDFDFNGPKKDGFAVDWPIRYPDIAPWYSYVEKYVGISGNKDGLAALPDGEFLPAMEMTIVEKYFKGKMDAAYSDRHVIVGRCAHVTKPTAVHLAQGRGACQARNLCQRGCPFGGYFNSNSTTIPAAQKTGNLTLKTEAVVHSIIYNEEKGRASGVRVIDTLTKEESVFYAKIIFVNAGTLNTNLILLNSKSKRFPNGLGNDHDILGKYVAFHNYRGSITAEFDQYKEYTSEGRRPTNMYIPRFRNLHKQETGFLRGYAVGFKALRKSIIPEGVGASLKNQLIAEKESNWQIKSHIMGETIPREQNRVSLDLNKLDEWGIPALNIDIDYTENEELMLKDYFEQVTEMFEKAGFTNIKTHDSKQSPGLDIHEMGGVRMGNEPQTSLLNNWNQMHLCNNVFVTDGACMTSTGTQNPSLTYMALTARACDYAFKHINEWSEKSVG